MVTINPKKQRAQAERQRKYHQEHKEELNKISRDYHAKNREEIIELKRQYNEAHREEIRRYNQKYLVSHRAQLAERQSKKVECACGAIITRGAVANHVISKKHHALLAAKATEQ